MIAQPDGFHVSMEQDGNHTRIRVSGELDIPAARRLVEDTGLPPPGPPLVIVDLSDLTFIDVAGLRGLIATRDRLRRLGHEVGFERLPRFVERLGDIVGIDLDGAEPPTHTTR